MDEVVRGLDFVYIDDVLITSSSTEEHVRHLHIPLDRFKTYGIMVNLSKCKLGVPALEFLGHYIDSHSVEPLQEKVEAFINYP